jgi:uncharacterized protein (DUF2384 family)
MVIPDKLRDDNIIKQSKADQENSTGMSGDSSDSIPMSARGERAERLIELSALVERLACVMEPSYIAVWLRQPVPALAERRPIDLIASGEYLRIAELASALEEAPFS